MIRYDFGDSVICHHFTHCVSKFVARWTHHTIQWFHQMILSSLCKGCEIYIYTCIYVFITLPETNIALESRPSQKDGLIGIPTIHFQVRPVSFGDSGRVRIIYIYICSRFRVPPTPPAMVMVITSTPLPPVEWVGAGKRWGSSSQQQCNW